MLQMTRFDLQSCSSRWTRGSLALFLTGYTIGRHSYTDFVEPLLNSITLKESKNVPKIYEEFGLTEDQFAEQMDLIQQVKAGNQSAIQQISG